MVKHVIILASMASVGLIGTGAGQSNQAQSVLDRIVTLQPNGGPFVFAPPITDWSDEATIGVGHAADVVVGFEAAPEVERILVPVKDHRRAELATRRRISLAGKTVRDRQVRHRCSPNDPRALEIQTLSYRRDEIAGGVGCMNVGQAR